MLSEKYEENHQPAMHKGTVIKINANQRYATTAPTALILREIARRRNIPIQVKKKKRIKSSTFIFIFIYIYILFNSRSMK